MNKRLFDIDGQTITIIETSLLKEKHAEGYARAGDYQDNTIRIEPKNSRRGKRIAMLHELLHHLCERSGVDKALGLKTEELVCDELASWLITANDSAPGLLKEIFTKEPRLRIAAARKR